MARTLRLRITRAESAVPPAKVALANSMVRETRPAIAMALPEAATVEGCSMAVAMADFTAMGVARALCMASMEVRAAAETTAPRWPRVRRSLWRDAGTGKSGGVFGDAEGGADFAEAAAFHVVHGDDVAVLGIEAGESGIEFRGDRIPRGVLLGVISLKCHPGGLLFVQAAAILDFSRVAGGVMGGEDEPTRERGAVADGVRLSGQENEDRLRDVLGKVLVADLTTRGRVYQVEMAGHELVKSVCRARLKVDVQQFRIFHRLTNPLRYGRRGGSPISWNEEYHRMRSGVGDF